MWDPYAEFEMSVLPNGLTVYAVHWPGRPWEAMGFLVHSGAEHDPIGLEGLTHFVEHLVSENASITRKDMRAFFEDYGGKVSLGETRHPHTQYRFFVPADKAVISKAFSMFGQMLLAAKLDKSIEKERQVIIGEFHRRYDAKYKFDLEMREHRMVFAGYWLERMTMPLGSPESVLRISQEDIQSYYDRHYTPANMSIVGVGALKLEEIIQLLTESPFMISKKGIRTPLPNPIADINPPAENSYVFEISKHTLMAEVGGYRSVAVIPGRINAQAVGLISGMLDDVLTDEVREHRTWTYNAGSSYFNHRHFYELSIYCEALALKALDEIENVVEDCISSLANQEELFEKVKKHNLAALLMLDFTGRGLCDDALEDLGRYQRILSLAEYLENIKRVNMSDIRNLLQWFKPQRRWTVIGKP